MKNWFTSLNGAITLSALALLTEVWRGFLDAMFDYPTEFGEESAMHFANEPQTAAAPPFSDLTPRELEVLQLIAQGLTNNAIAEKLVLSPKTVRNQVSTIFSKMQVANRAEAIVRAREAGLGM